MDNINEQTGEIMPTLTFETSPEIGDLVGALAKARIEMKNPEKTGKGNRGQYADLPTVVEAITPALSKHGLVAMQPTQVVEGDHYLVTILAHQSGQWMRGYCELYGDESNKGSRDQALGSSMTYMRRYCLSAMVGVAGADDNDPDSASSPNTTRSTGDRSRQSGRKSRSRPTPPPSDVPPPEEPSIRAQAIAPVEMTVDIPAGDLEGKSIEEIDKVTQDKIREELLERALRGEREVEAVTAKDDPWWEEHRPKLELQKMNNAQLDGWIKKLLARHGEVVEPAAN